MKTRLILFLLFFSQFSFSQNLVPNPSFEDTLACPTGPGHMDCATGWSSYRNSPDYINLCGPSAVGVPTNLWGFQYARTGNAYAGLAIYHSLISNGREYLGIQLSQSLIIGQQYFASFFVSLGVQNISYIGVATNRIGMRLSTIAFSSNTPLPIDNIAQIFTNSIITDSINWVQISGTFTADSAYDYLCIGNFFNDSLTSSLSFDSAVYSYYYVDDVYLSIADSNTDAVNEANPVPVASVFPNPAKDWLVVEGSGICNISLYNILGKRCFSTVVSSALITKINVSTFNKGIYYLSIETKTLNTKIKIIIQ